jgi:hypothetical protein
MTVSAVCYDGCNQWRAYAKNHDHACRGWHPGRSVRRLPVWGVLRTGDLVARALTSKASGAAGDLLVAWIATGLLGQVDAARHGFMADIALRGQSAPI